MDTTRSCRTHLARALSKLFLLSSASLAIGGGLTAGADEAEEKLLDSATAYMRQASGYHVEATLSINNNKSLVSADIAGDDYDVTINSGVAVRHARGKDWSSQDGGKTWRASKSSDDAIFDLLRAPLRGAKVPSNGRLAMVQQDNERERKVALLELRFDPPSDKEFQIRYWVAKAQGDRTWIERFNGPVTFMGSLVIVDARYSKVDEIMRIAPPPSR